MNFFKAYDMRGTYGRDFTLEVVNKVGRALPQVVSGKRWLVGHDCRTTGPAVADAVINGLRSADVDVTAIGYSTTPMIYFLTAQNGFDGSIMVTASHNPPTDNGLKVSKKGALPVGYASGLNQVEQLIKSDTTPYTPPTDLPKPTLNESFCADYLAWQKEHGGDYSNLRFAVDCSNGMSALLAPKLYPNAIILNETLDGTFPNHSPNPLTAAAREQLIEVVRREKLDCGVIFDGDADRAMFVDENGDFVQPDYLIPLVARETRLAGFAPQSEPIIIHDVRTSRGVIDTLKADGFTPAMVPVGHAFAKPALRKLNALCGGEVAGHYYFAEFFCCDSGILAANRILSAIARAKRSGQTFSQLMKPICTKYANSGELNFRVPDTKEALAHVQACVREAFPPEIDRSEIDGVRLEQADGWLSIRLSNTEPLLRLIAEAPTRELLDARLNALIEKADIAAYRI